MGVGVTSLGHLWTGRRRPHNHYVIGDPAYTTPTAYSVGTAGRRIPSTGDCGPQDGAAEKLLSTTLLGSLARGHGGGPQPFKGRVIWWSRGSYVPEQAPQGATGRGLGWSRGPRGPEEQHDFGGGSRGWNRD